MQPFTSLKSAGETLTAVAKRGWAGRGGKLGRAGHGDITPALARTVHLGDAMEAEDLGKTAGQTA